MEKQCTSESSAMKFLESVGRYLDHFPVLNPLRATGNFQKSAFCDVPRIIASVLLTQSSQSRASWKGIRERKRMRSIMIASTPSIQR